MNRTAILSDIHGNILSLQAVLQDVRAQGCQQIFVLGDIINGMNPSACVAELKTCSNIAAIKGNAEHYVLTPDLDTFPRKNEPMYQSLIVLIEWWRIHMSKTAFEFIQDLPDFLYADDWYMVHDSPLDRIRVKQIDLDGMSEKYREVNFHGPGIPENMDGEDLETILKLMDTKSVSTLFVGHTHIPYIKRIDGKVICNAGSVGFALDGDPRPSWILLENHRDDWQITIRRVEYDIDQAVQMMLEVGFLDFVKPQRDAYIKMLQTGIHWRAHI